MVESKNQFVSYEMSDGVGTLTLDRPPVDVVNIAMLREMETVLTHAVEDLDLKILIVRAEGKLFSAGVDVAEHTPELVGEMIPLFDQVCQSIADFPLPTVAVVNGHALGGGCEIVICCDFAFMAEEARIGQPEIQLAAMAPIATLRLPILVGPRWAARILFTGDQFEAATAEKIGLINGALPSNELGKVVDALTGKLSQLSAAALRMNKKSYLKGLAGWDANLIDLEQLYLHELMATEDAVEGLQAFMEKRKPVWKNR